IGAAPPGYLYFDPVAPLLQRGEGEEIKGDPIWFLLVLPHPPFAAVWCFTVIQYLISQRIAVWACEP
ncbi:hypothetical protein, partial [Anaerotruncus colihominis]|uniref:hypothetical protein n=1 Tax=Anaerotruncus colihominis TaxID=169435 RepID=UPI0024321E0E